MSSVIIRAIMDRIASTLLVSSVFGLIFATSALAQTTASPTLKVVTPSEGQTIYGNRIPILFSIENFQLADFQTNPNIVGGQGHIHLWLDDTNPTRESAKMLTSDNFAYSDVAHGNHSLRAELVNNNHSSLVPPITTTVNFKNSPITTPSPVATSGFDKNTALVILIVVALVILAAWWYTKEEEEPPKPAKTTKKTARKRRR
ncbi:hypothetical protein A3H87_01880 [Candidatus Curtissbacteria bacterium RIFCSPLOWO2_02_FULL_42_37]|uniref:CopC domain-containing protein n=1 Tax=Candidatus Curtissbacteria bacterium RIFCSPLOWO2_01_FULL_42_50 TaxID=1797730 RepID=A0A1F5H7S2_9BACT|nr:MAG: hypothetical protein A3C33_01465 [Candidatus Curtissbacteria bacterium RIFCSPHIGHO2_02_FULL_42_58]OGD97009.1 MAG: hypothetical protein A3E71_01555 [Candidatus Curtissbacteria bacterium RIFCSPHIGHO2_12_FULL_42_33]OGE00217.1 MAG: hypothetical protein A3B54_02545 [Candidatus Curtissbacteria bacterium RIFCSPLOWO2_01_FULL_42_50]OGE10006.1 MAG: hypothetical protein A3H87_01880 [Candidatus Curtissbacteria bacterium RIFCSPLOWO2_02_FULL_42_37]